MRRLGAEVVVAGLCFALLCFALLIPGLAVAQAPAPVKIGMLVPLTGVFTRNGREAVDGARL